MNQSDEENEEGLIAQTTLELADAPTNIDSALKLHDWALLRSLGICFPACVYSYDRTSHTVEVMPLVKQGFYQGKWFYLNRNVKIKTTIRNIQCGGFTIDYPVYIGDTGWVFASDRDTTLLKQIGALTNSVLAEDRSTEILDEKYQQKPVNLAVHSFTSGFFIPDNWGTWTPVRCKDSNNIALSNALYIGASMDTPDEGADLDERLQHGGKYEQKDTAAMVIEREGGVHLISSTAFTDEKDENGDEIARKQSRLSVKGGNVFMSTANLGTTDAPERFHSFSMDADKGVVFRSIGGSHHATLSLEDGNMVLRIGVGTSVCSMTLGSGGFDIQTDANMNISCGGDVNINAQTNALISAASADISVGTTASIKASSIEALAVRSIKVASGDNLQILTGGAANITAGGFVNVLAKDGSLTLRTQASNSHISIEADKSSIDICSKGYQGGINIKTEGEGGTIYLATNGLHSNIAISALGETVISANGDGEIDGGGLIAIRKDGMELKSHKIWLNADEVSFPK